ncbi:MAG: hypothetical protein IPJ26_17290 [Bacteroidetes bacterium]|nr:hypothetical protein [Bacteroidota bacterium]MBP6040142.1 hypothetical protein [Flavobacterium sp.]MBP6414387.1 hypothetical protein [Bacteroidia bacterium]
MKQNFLFAKLQLQATQLWMDIISLTEGNQTQKHLVNVIGEAVPDYSTILNSLSNELEDVFSV